MFLFFSLGIRFLQSHKSARKLLNTFGKWQADIENLSLYKNKDKKLLIIAKSEDDYFFETFVPENIYITSLISNALRVRKFEFHSLSMDNKLILGNV